VEWTTTTPEQDERLKVLEACGILDTPPEPEFDEIAALAADICDAPMAVVSVIDRERQWMKARIGFGLSEVPSEDSLCINVFHAGETISTPDASADPRFRGSPLVSGEPHIRCYAGAPVRLRDGHVLGTVCVADTVPRELGPSQLQRLGGLAAQAAALIDRRRNEVQLSEALRRLNEGERLAHLGSWEWDPEREETYWSDELEQILGVDKSFPHSLEGFLGLIHKQDLARVRALIEEATEKEEDFSYRARIRRPDGEVRVIDAYGQTAYRPSGKRYLRGAARDVTELVAAEEAGRTQAQALSAAFDSALDAMFVAEDDGRFTEVNPAACALLGYEREQLLSMNLEEVVAERHRDQAMETWRGFIAAGMQRGEIQLERRDGAEVLAEYSARANFVPGQHLAILRDVTQRRREEREMMEARSRLEESQALAHVGSWEWDPHQDRSVWSPELLRIAGLDPYGPSPDLAGTLYVVADEDRERFRERASAALAGEREFRGVFGLTRPDGEVRKVETRGRVERDAKGRVVRIYGAAQDITERVQAEQELRIRGEILDQVEAGVVTLDLERRITNWNRGAENLYGWTREEVIGRPARELSLIPEDSVVGARATTEQALAGKTIAVELMIRRKDGGRIQVRTTISPVRDREGALVGFVGVSMDITDQKRHQAELERSRRETIHRLARAMETRDRDTGGHIERIGEWTAMIGQHLGLDPERVELLRVASPMHDVGKIGISDNVLRKPGKLTPEERAEMERHVEIGHRILAGSGIEVLELAAEIALTHHEWWDGSGYPRGLSRSEIPLSGRIVAVADVFDALTTDRVYRPAMPIDQAIELMRSERGTHFDPEVLDVLLEDVPAFAAIQRRNDNGHH
jgi:PAS domain S-box-containing protein